MSASVSTESIATLYNIPATPQNGAWTLTDAYAFCRNLTTSHYENFPVGSMLLPKAKRLHVYPIYAFARISDDFADEPEYEGQRLDLLNDWEARLEACVDGRAEDPIFLALADTLQKCDLPVQLFRDLLHAFKRDVTVSRYSTFDDVTSLYCRYSANPVGRLILHLFDYRDDERLHASDCICTALQLANFWQDVAVDLRKERVYIPTDMMDAQGFSIDELFAHTYDERLVRIMQDLGLKTWRLFDEGYRLLDSVHWPLSSELRFTWMGGMTILTRMLENQCNVFMRPKLGKWDAVRLGARSLMQIDSVRDHWCRQMDEVETSLNRGGTG